MTTENIDLRRSEKMSPHREGTTLKKNNNNSTPPSENQTNLVLDPHSNIAFFCPDFQAQPVDHR